jgi:hypothetical protein
MRRFYPLHSAVPQGMVSFGEILELDFSFKDMLWMTRGMQAWLNTDTNEWQTATASGIMSGG